MAESIREYLLGLTRTDSWTDSWQNSPMKTLLITILFSAVLPLAQASSIKDIKPGDYNLVDGNEEYCEEGPIVIKDGDLRIGARFVMMQFEKPTYSYESDDKTCAYHIKNTLQKNGLKQEIDHKCKEVNLKRSIFLTVLSPTRLSYTVVAEDMKVKKYNCSLELAK